MSVKRGWQLVVSAMLAAALAVATLGPAVADERRVSSDETSDRATSLSKAAIEDLAWQADLEGISLQESIERYGWHEPFAILAHALRTEYPEDFAGARILPEEATAWVAFKREVPRQAARAVAAFDHPVDVVEHRGYSEQELDAQLINVHHEILALDYVETASSGYDIASGVIKVEVQVDPDLTSTSDTENVERILTNVPDAMGSNVVLAIVDNVEGVGDTTLYGGGTLSECTAGFTLKKTNGLRNVSTAGHCGNNLTYGSTTLTWGDEHQGTWGDVQRMSAPLQVTLSDDFYYKSGSRRDTISTGFPSEGQLLYRYGKSTGRQSDNVYQLNHCNGSRCHLTAMHNREASGGDSGGPWYLGNTAYGIHQGGKWWNLKWRDLFTPVSYIDDGMSGWSVATS